MFKRKQLSQLLDWLKTDKNVKENITHWEIIEGKEADYVPMPDDLHPELKKALEKRGITQLYSHQKEAKKPMNRLS